MQAQQTAASSTAAAAAADVAAALHVDSSEVKVTAPLFFPSIFTRLSWQHAPSPHLALTCARSAPQALQQRIAALEKHVRPASLPSRHFPSPAMSHITELTTPSPLFSASAAFKPKRRPGTAAASSLRHHNEHSPFPSSRPFLRRATSRANASSSIERTVELAHDASAGLPPSGGFGIGHSAAASG